MSIDDLTTEMIGTLNKFSELDINKIARDYWADEYRTSRIKRGTIGVHCIDSTAYEIANRKLEALYIAIKYER